MGDLQVAHRVLAELFADDPEPIPTWDEGDQAKLETCRGCIEVQSGGVLKYPDVPSAAAKLFYSTIKLHAFPNGNKRFALALTLAFILKNGLMFTAPEGVSADTAEAVAESDPHADGSRPDEVVERLTTFYEEHLAPAEDVFGGSEIPPSDPN